MANTTFGGSIKLTGESEYRSALKNIKSDMSLLSSEMKVLATSTDNSGNMSAQDKAKKEALTKAIGDQKDKVADLNKQLQDSIAKTGENSNSTKALQTQVNNATAQLNQMEGTLSKVGENMDDTGKKAGIFGDVLKANLASEAIVAGVKAIGSGVKALAGEFVGLVKDSVGAFADYEQLTGGVETLFKDSAGKVEGYAQQAYKTAGLSANQYMEQATSFSATLLQGLGGDTAKASEYANQAIVDMSDNANKMGTDISLIQNAYQGFAKDNYTMLDNLKLGYGGTASEMARLINDSGVMGEGFKATAENVKDIPFDKMIDALHKTQEQLGITGTTAKEASATISGSFNATKSAWENVVTSFGSGNNDMIKEAIDGLIGSAKDLVTNVTAILPNIIDGIGQLVAGVIEVLPSMVQSILPTLSGLITNIINSLVTIVPQIIPVAMGLITTLINTLVQNLPAIINGGIQLITSLVTGIAQSIPTIIPALLTGIQTFITTIIQNLPLIIESGITLLVSLVQGIANALPELIKMIPTIIDTLIKTLTDPKMITLLIKASLDIIVALAGGLIKAIPEIVKMIPQIITSIVTGLINGLGSLADVGKQLIEGLWNGISNATKWIMDKISGFAKGIVDGIKGFFGIHSPSRLFRDEIGKNLALGVGEGFTDNMGDVVKEMKEALPTSFDTAVAVNSPLISSQVAEDNSIKSQTASDKIVTAIQDALGGAKIELEGQQMGSFVTTTVQREIYGV
jgi:phage-related protein